VNSMSVLSGVLYSSSLPPEASPVHQGYADLGRHDTRGWTQQHMLKDPSIIFFMSLGPHVGAQSLCACPPSAIKGEACDVTQTRNLRLASSYKPTSNTSQSRVLRSGGPNHSKILVCSCVLPLPSINQAKRLSPSSS
jgi:hypothetical protein